MLQTINELLMYKQRVRTHSIGADSLVVISSIDTTANEPTFRDELTHIRYTTEKLMLVTRNKDR
jgi:hypothetical protein